MAVNPLFFGYNFLQVLQNLENRENMRLQFRYIRDTINPFELPDKKFLKLFRLNKQATLSLIEELGKFVDESTRRDTIFFHLRVFASVLFFSSGSYQTIIGEDLNIGLSQSAMSRVINEISNLISTHLLARYIKFPTSEVEIRNVKEGDHAVENDLNFMSGMGKYNILNYLLHADINSVLSSNVLIQKDNDDLIQGRFVRSQVIQDMFQ